MEGRAEPRLESGDIEHSTTPRPPPQCHQVPQFLSGKNNDPLPTSPLLRNPNKNNSTSYSAGRVNLLSRDFVSLKKKKIVSIERMMFFIEKV